MMNDICEINRITPFQGLDWRGDSFRRAMPYAIDYRAFSPSVNIKGSLMDFSTPKVMGILNITPDSFFEGSRKQTEEEIRQRMVQIVEEGADIIDIGGYSSVPMPHL